MFDAELREVVKKTQRIMQVSTNQTWFTQTKGETTMIDTKALNRRCSQPARTFEGKQVNTVLGSYIYKDNGSNILAVAHLDSVCPPDFFVAAGDYIMSPVLDDRLGVYIILDYLPKLSLRYDVLLTTGEEWARSTAEFFSSRKQYNWMFEFDRGGMDTVLYQYETEETMCAVESVGVPVGLGTYSDIVVLDQLGCSGFNWGTAYELEHSFSSYVIPSECEWMIDRFVEFYRKYKNTRFEYEYDPTWACWGARKTGNAYWGSEAYQRGPKDWAEDFGKGLDWTLEECEWCGIRTRLKETLVEDCKALLCQDCVDYYHEYKGDYYG